MKWEIDLGNGETIKHYGNSNLVLSGCTTLVSLPDGLRVSGHLDLSKCTALTHLPDRLKVCGDLALNGCTSLISLPKGLDAFSLYLRGCTALRSLPEDLRVKRWIYVGDCYRLYIPSTIQCESIEIDSDQYFICRNRPGKLKEYPVGIDCILMREGGD